MNLKKNDSNTNIWIQIYKKTCSWTASSHDEMKERTVQFFFKTNFHTHIRICIKYHMRCICTYVRCVGCSMLFCCTWVHVENIQTLTILWRRGCVAISVLICVCTFVILSFVENEWNYSCNTVTHAWDDVEGIFFHDQRNDDIGEQRLYTAARHIHRKLRSVYSTFVQQSVYFISVFHFRENLKNLIKLFLLFLCWTCTNNSTNNCLWDLWIWWIWWIWRRN